MKNIHFTPVLLALMLSSCFPIDREQKRRELKQEILKIEADFVSMVEKEGIANAFVYYAAENAVLLRNDQLILGKSAISNRYKEKERNSDVRLTWVPDYVDVSDSGDMAYTYGTYRYTFKDELGNIQNETGIFHTVWKRQKDGSWKYVWD